ncbi:MAG: hypothetical protein GXO79_13945 [Chlorobi bacterium]|nr:hypothetical protein [Chlorobiota bacterium]
MNKLKIFVLHIIILSLIIVFSCVKETSTPDLQIDYSYFPVDTGYWYEYNVTNITIDVATSKFDTVNYKLKEVFESKFTDNEGNESIRIERYIKENGSTKWEIKDVWYATLLQNSVQKVEENIRYVKLIFPVKLNISWNGNAYNIYSNDNLPEYEITSLDEPETINNLLFDSVLTVTQADNLSLIDKLYKTEKYAKNIGLVEKTEIDVYSKFTDNSVDIMDRITLGTIYKQEIIQYGKNEKK